MSIRAQNKFQEMERHLHAAIDLCKDMIDDAECEKEDIQAFAKMGLLLSSLAGSSTLERSREVIYRVKP